MVFPDIFVNDIVLRQVDKQKYLGVMFDTRLSWTHQVSNVCKNMAYYLHLLNLHKHCLSPHLLKLLVESLVLSRLSYALSVWGPSLSQQLLQRLERSQNCAVRLCRNLSRFDHVSGHYRALRWVAITAAYSIPICWYDVSSISSFTGDSPVATHYVWSLSVSI